MPGPRDQDLVLRDGGTDLTVTETLTTKTLRGGNADRTGMSLFWLIPQDSGTDTLAVAAKFLDTGKKIEVTHTDAHVSGTDTTPVVYSMPLPRTDAESLSVVLTVVGSADFGAVQVWLERAEKAKVPDAA